jgi:hypothetical protein
MDPESMKPLLITAIHKKLLGRTMQSGFYINLKTKTPFKGDKLRLIFEPGPKLYRVPDVKIPPVASMIGGTGSSSVWAIMLEQACQTLEGVMGPLLEVSLNSC